jgi:hypothetical protein
VANGQRSRFRNSELRACDIDCLVKIALTGATWLPLVDRIETIFK